MVFALGVVMFSTSGRMPIIAHRGTPPRSIDRSWLSCDVIQFIAQVLSITPSRSKPTRGYGLVFRLICRFVPTSRRLVSHLALESIFLGCQDFCPSICEQILIRLKLLLLLLQASRSGNKPVLEALLLCGVLGHAKLVVAEANIVFGGGM